MHFSWHHFWANAVWGKLIHVIFSRWLLRLEFQVVHFRSIMIGQKFGKKYFKGYRLYNNTSDYYQSGPHIGFCMDLVPSDQMNQERFITVRLFPCLHCKSFLWLAFVACKEASFCLHVVCITRVPFPSTRYHFWPVVYMTYIINNIFFPF